MFSKLRQKKSVAVYAATAINLIIIYSMIFLYFARVEYHPEYVNLITAVYWVITSMTTVGYGDIVLTSNAGKIFSIIVQLSGVIMLFGWLFPLVITPKLEKMVKIILPTKAQEDLNNHIIVCGYNRLVETLIDELKENGISFVIVEDNEHIIRELMEKGIQCIYGIPSEEETLKNANIYTAKVLIANKSDEMDANIVLTARELTDIDIIAVVEEVSNAKYLRYAGANRVVSPKSMFGRFIGIKAVDPFLSRLTGATEFFEGISIVEFPIYPKSPLIGETLRTAAIHERTGANIVGIWKGGNLSLNPLGDDVIKENSVLLAIGRTEELYNLKKLTR